MARILWGYVRRHRSGLLSAALMVGILFVVFYLYAPPWEAMLYGLLLCTAALLMVHAVGLYRYRKRHRRLEALCRRTEWEPGELPEAEDLLEEDFARLYESLSDAYRKLETDARISHTEAADYYTMWVHQIKTPIAAMKLLLQSEADGGNSAVQAELFKIEQYAEMALQYQRLEGDGTDYVLRRCPLDDIVCQAVRKYARLFVLKRLQLHYDPLNVTVLTDEKWLGFVIEQLLSNALKYTKSGGISLYMRDPGHLVIEDTGIGIAPEDLPRLCERGFTGANGRLDKKATGLGLYLCRRILHNLSHTITLESTVGEGTRVILGLESAALRVE